MAFLLEKFIKLKKRKKLVFLMGEKFGKHLLNIFFNLKLNHEEIKKHFNFLQFIKILFLKKSFSIFALRNSLNLKKKEGETCF